MLVTIHTHCWWGTNINKKPYSFNFWFLNSQLTYSIHFSFFKAKSSQVLNVWANLKPMAFFLAWLIASDRYLSSTWSLLMSLIFQNFVSTTDSSFNAWAFSSILLQSGSTPQIQSLLVLILQSNTMSPFAVFSMILFLSSLLNLLLYKRL